MSKTYCERHFTMYEGTCLDYEAMALEQEIAECGKRVQEAFRQAKELAVFVPQTPTEKVEPEPVFHPGDVVRLKYKSRPMTVHRILEDGVVEVKWFQNGTLFTGICCTGDLVLALGESS